jgi:protein gp37
MGDLKKMASAEWPVVVGCEVLTEGCESCPSYHSAIANKGVVGHIFEHGYDVRVIEDQLDKPSANPIPTIYSVAFGSDLFHESVTENYLKRIFATMNATPRHIYEVPTKRAERMYTATKLYGLKWTDNIFAGVHIESGEYVWRMNYLQKLNAKHKYLSIVPLLGDMGVLDLTGISYVSASAETWHNKRPCDANWVADIQRQCNEQGVEFSWDQGIAIWEEDN